MYARDWVCVCVCVCAYTRMGIVHTTMRATMTTRTAGAGKQTELVCAYPHFRSGGKHHYDYV